MRRVLLALASCALGLGLTAGTASAEPYGRVDAVRLYAPHGAPCRGGYYYRGHGHHHWAYRVWDGACHRWNYYDPYRHCSYYWCAPDNCYRPVTSCP
jgi:hypothetical protein